MGATNALSLPATSSWRRYLELTKPRVVALMLFTAVVGMILATDGPVPWVRALAALLGIALAAGAGAAVNHVIDRQIDGIMSRTCGRPIPTRQVDARSALGFATVLAVLAMFILVTWVNLLTAVLTFAAMIGYAVIYTVFLKRTTPQNVVWGGAAGAAPPVLGAAAITGEVQLDAVLLFLIVFIWTPPHFWPLAIHRREEYSRVGLPMLPVTHGVQFTKAQVLNYAFMLFGVSLLPYAAHTTGLVYLGGAIPLGLGFIYHAWRLYRSDGHAYAMATFRYSILYLFLLFALMIADHLTG